MTRSGDAFNVGPAACARWTGGVRAKTIALAVGLLAATAAWDVAQAAEIHSNGIGGGRWSSPSTWHGGIVPTAEDEVVISMRDTVEFDGGATPDQPACRGLFIDPEGVLTFRPTDGRSVLAIAGPLESYGVVRVDATRSRGRYEIRFVDQSGAASFDLKQNSGLLAYGRENPRGLERNVVIAAGWGDLARPVAEGESSVAQPSHVQMTGAGDVMVDVQRVALEAVHVNLSDLDNTGAAYNERLNLNGNVLTADSRFALTRCDTPAIRGNIWPAPAPVEVEAAEAADEAQALEAADADASEEVAEDAPPPGPPPFVAPQTPVTSPAIRLEGCKLAEVRDNRVEGRFQIGLWTGSDIDSTAVDNVFLNLEKGIRWHGQNAMIRANRMEGCVVGIDAVETSGVMENVLTVGCQTGFLVTRSQLQMTNCGVASLPLEGVGLSLNAASVELLNCNITDDLIHRAGGSPPGGTWAQAMDYLVVHVDADVPPGTVVWPRTAQVSGGVPQGKADLNVRNGPATLDRRNHTPLPGTLKALVLRSWRLGADGKRVNAPFYDLMILGPAPAGGERPILHQQMIEPDPTWYRPQPDAPVATLEVSLP